MDELQKLRGQKEETFTKYIHHQELAKKHEALARKARYEQLDINDRIRALERELSTPIKVIYHEGNQQRI